MSVSPGVRLGPTFRVVSCCCANDVRIRDKMDEWCEFCLCRSCGGKNLPLPKGAAASAFDFALPSRLPEASDLSPALGLCLALIALGLGGTIVYCGDALYRYLYLMGAVAASFLARDLATVGKFRPMH